MAVFNDSSMQLPVQGYLIYRDSAPDLGFDPTAPLAFYPPKDSDELFDALRAKYPAVKTHSERMRDAIIEFLLEERAADMSPTTIPDNTTLSPWQQTWPSMTSTATTSSVFSSPEIPDLATPTFGNSPQASASRHGSASTSMAASTGPSPPQMEQMTGVFAVSASSQPKQRIRRKMTEAEKVEYRKRRIVKACDKCSKRKRKCHHNQPEMEHLSTRSSKITKPCAQTAKVDLNLAPPDLQTQQYNFFDMDLLMDDSFAVDMPLFDDMSSYIDDSLFEQPADQFENYSFDAFVDYNANSNKKAQILSTNSHDQLQQHGAHVKNYSSFGFDDVLNISPGDLALDYTTQDVSGQLTALDRTRSGRTFALQSNNRLPQGGDVTDYSSDEGAYTPSSQSSQSFEMMRSGSGGSGGSDGSGRGIFANFTPYNPSIDPQLFTLGAPHAHQQSATVYGNSMHGHTVDIPQPTHTPHTQDAATNHAHVHDISRAPRIGLSSSVSWSQTVQNLLITRKAIARLGRGVTSRRVPLSLTTVATLFSSRSSDISLFANRSPADRTSPHTTDPRLIAPLTREELDLDRESRDDSSLMHGRSRRTPSPMLSVVARNIGESHEASSKPLSVSQTVHGNMSAQLSSLRRRDAVNTGSTNRQTPVQTFASEQDSQSFANVLTVFTASRSGDDTSVQDVRLGRAPSRTDLFSVHRATQDTQLQFNTIERSTSTPTGPVHTRPYSLTTSGAADNQQIRPVVNVSDKIAAADGSSGRISGNHALTSGAIATMLVAFMLCMLYPHASYMLFLAGCVPVHAARKHLSIVKECRQSVKSKIQDNSTGHENSNTSLTRVRDILVCAADYIGSAVMT